MGAVTPPPLSDLQDDEGAGSHLGHAPPPDLRDGGAVPGSLGRVHYLLLQRLGSLPVPPQRSGHHRGRDVGDGGQGQLRHDHHLPQLHAAPLPEVSSKSAGNRHPKHYTWIGQPGFHEPSLGRGKVRGSQGTEGEKMDCGRKEEMLAECYDRSTRNFATAVAPRTDGRPNFMERKACHFFTEMFQTCSENMIRTSCYSSEDMDTMVDENLHAELERWTGFLTGWDS